MGRVLLWAVRVVVLRACRIGRGAPMEDGPSLGQDLVKIAVPRSPARCTLGPALLTARTRQRPAHVGGPMITLSDADLLARADALSAAFLRAARGRPGTDVRIDDDVVSGLTGIPLPMFNTVTDARFAPDTVDRRIEEVLRPFRERGIDMTWRVGSTSSPGDLVDRLVAHGLRIDELLPVMALRLDGWHPEPPAPGVAVNAVEDVAAFRTAVDIVITAFEMPAALGPVLVDRFASDAIAKDGMQRVFLATLDGRPVATSLGVLEGDVIGIYNVATLPDSRGRGAGRTVTGAAVADGRARGAVAAVLETSPLGRPVYERMGFLDVGTATMLLGTFARS